MASIACAMAPDGRASALAPLAGMAGEQDTRPLNVATAVTAHISAPAFFPLTRERMSEKDEPETLVVQENSPVLKSVSAPVMVDRGGLTQSGPPRARPQNDRAG